MSIFICSLLHVINHHNSIIIFEQVIDILGNASLCEQVLNVDGVGIN